MRNVDLAELMADYQALPPEEKPKAIEARYLEKHGVIVPPISCYFTAPAHRC